MAKKGIVGVLSAIVIAVAAIGIYRWLHPTPLGLIRQMLGKLNSVNSFNAEMTIEMGGTLSIGGIEADLGLDSDTAIETVISAGTSHQKGDIKVSLLGMSYDAPLESYQQAEGSKMTSYTSINGGKWIKSVADASQESPQGQDGQQPEESQDVNIDVDSKMVIGLFRKIVSGEVQTVLAKETETICGKEAYRIDITVAGDLLEDLAKILVRAMGENLQLPDNLDLSKVKAVLVLHIYKDSRLPASVRIDCTELGNALLFDTLQQEGIQGHADRFVFEFVVSEYNTIEKIEIPQEVISTAVEGEDANILDILIPGTR